MSFDNPKSPIGIFDSGVGGLTVVSEVMNALPNENIVYFGDTARVPYGSKSKDTVTKFSKQIMRFLISKDVKAVIIACNTVSSNSYFELLESFEIPIFEVVSPGATALFKDKNCKSVGIIGTEATIRSRAYENAILALNPNIQVFSKSCPLFVPLAEEGWTSNSVAQITAEIYLQEMIDREVEALILGCTHYPLLKDIITKTVAPMKIINPAETVAENINNYLSENKLLNSSGGYAEFYVSDNTSKFKRICKNVLGKVYEPLKIEIENF